MPVRRQHRKPEVPREALEAEKIAKQMYGSLTLKTAPRATPGGYVMGSLSVVKLLIDQAVQQGSDKDKLKQYAISFIEGI